MNSIAAVILGGGRGTRLFPLTLQRSKPAVSFAGKYRLIDIPLSNCINSGIKRVSVLTQFMSASLHRHIMQTYQFDTFSDGFVEVLAAEQTPQGADWFQGTADAVRATLNHTTYYDFSQMLILSGDHLYRMDYRKLMAFHTENKADISLCLYPVDFDEATRMGLCRVNTKGEIEEFVEKPKDPEVVERLAVDPTIFKSRGIDIDENRCLASMGVYVFEPKVLKDLLANKEKTDFGKEILPAAINKYKVMAYPFTDYWADIGTIQAFFDSNIELARQNAPFRLYQPNWPVYTRTRSLPPTRVIRSNIRDSLLVEGSDITGAHINDSIIGMRSIIGENSNLREVVMLGADFYEGEHILSSQKRKEEGLPSIGIGKGCMLERTIIDKNARIGDGVVIRDKTGEKDYNGESYWIRDGITIIPKGSVIPAGTIV
ncbi:MAG: glucose-1-phosphate adenylyltransferase [Chitinivibrionales bacterium]